MRNVYAVLKEKQRAVKRVRREIEALRLVCDMMDREKHSRGDSIRITLESSIEEKTPVPSPAEEKKAALQQIQARLLEAPKEIEKENGRNVLLQFRQAALVASQTLLKRVRDRRLWERESHIRDLWDRIGRAA